MRDPDESPEPLEVDLSEGHGFEDGNVNLSGNEGAQDVEVAFDEAGNIEALGAEGLTNDTGSSLDGGDPQTVQIDPDMGSVRSPGNNVRGIDREDDRPASNLDRKLQKILETQEAILENQAVLMAMFQQMGQMG